MNRVTLGITTSIVLTALGCGDTSGTGNPIGGSTGTGTGDDFVPPSEVSIQIRETVVRPWDHNNEQWDGVSGVSSEDIQALAEILASIDPYAGAAAYIADLANRGWGLPDPWGYAELFIDGQWSPDIMPLGNIDTNFDNTCVSPWNVGWDRVPIQETMKVHVELYEEDLQYDDPIGNVELNYSDLMDAVKSNQVFNVQVSDQGQGAILFVGISVTAQSTP